ncbi:alpha/beta fold hydrolase [Candidatus Nitrosocosmicus franklandus]|uniref:Peptidase S33 tripeptidyl aminopeptidase-like C-terminal domain-containing protein n=1 Tax=Candidatus Nitrosocosmicus franklandianus TaxID=1798806 RepID=A0A484IHP4_9ARCH|nr:alpha/beta hydrolase [Candidatus Nitrosocosmicus franklandus]VFJ15175.1 protein of unknown function [Candidatus Nitrosocosmicus franklandus]
MDSLILYASSCDGPDSVPPTPEVMETYSNTSSTPEEVGQSSITLMFPKLWFEANPNYLNYVPVPSKSVSPDVMEMQIRASENWSGKCQILGNISSSTIAIVGTDDYFTPAENSVNIVQKIPGAWLMKIKDAGHGLMYQYPEIFNKAVLSFLNIQELQSSNTNSNANHEVRVDMKPVRTPLIFSNDLAV